ncbi:MAG: hypothetical protein WC026_13295 [Hyphomicrobium sp.]|uniref:hypothetical protein n=1 Tax=Hyphomicrobium sp. TaxID=82 RepID=UPI0035623E36
MNYKDIKIEQSHLGNYKRESEQHGFNTIVLSCPVQGKQEDWQMVGRIVQVRKKSGIFGSDTILVRQLDGNLQAYENNSFFSVHDDFKGFYDELFKDLPEERPNIEYSMSGGNHKAIGFIVEGMDCTDGRIGSFVVQKEDNGNVKIKC